jgi:hypothetical protein
MSPELRSLEVVLLALIVAGSLYWQQRLLRDDCRVGFPPRRLYIPLVVSLLVLIGYLFYGVLSLTDARKPEFGAGSFLEVIAKALVVALALNVKTLLGPIFIGYSIGAMLYCYFEYNEWAFWPLLDLLLDWLFEGSPRWFKYVYLTATFGYALVASVVDDWLG